MLLFTVMIPEQGADKKIAALFAKLNGKSSYQFIVESSFFSGSRCIAIKTKRNVEILEDAFAEAFAIVAGLRDPY